MNQEDLLKEIESLRLRVADLEEIQARLTHMERALRESEERFRILYENTPLGYHSLDREGRIVEVNTAWLETLGYRREDVIGRWFGEFLDSDYVEQFRDTFRSLKDTGKAYRIEFDMVREDGSTISTAVDGQIGRDGQGRFKQTHCIVRDLTEVRRSERALRESEALFRTMFHQAAVGVAQIESLTGQFIRINQKYCDIVGYSRDELERLTFADITHPEDLPADLENMQRLCDGLIREFSVNKRYRRKDGSIVWVNLTVSPMWAVGEDPGYHVAVVRDITDQKQAEEALEQSEERFRLAMEATNDGLWDWDLKTDQSYRSPRFYSMLGYDEEDYPPGFKRGLELIHPDDRKPTIKALNACLTGETRTHEAEYRMLHKSGHWVWILSRGKVLARDGSGAPLRMVGTHIDITERKLANEALQVSEANLKKAQEIGKMGSWTYDMSGNITFSDELYRIYGISRETFGHDKASLFSIIHPEDRPAMQAWIDDCAAQKRPGELLLRMVWPDGTVRHISGRGELICDADGKPLLMAGTAQDITEAKLAEASLLRYAERLRNLHTTDRAILLAIDSPESIVRAALENVRRLLTSQRASVGIFDFEKQTAEVFAADVDGETIFQVGEEIAGPAYGDLTMLRQGKMQILEDISAMESPSDIVRSIYDEGVRSCIKRSPSRRKGADRCFEPGLRRSAGFFCGRAGDCKGGSGPDRHRHRACSHAHSRGEPCAGSGRAGPGAHSPA